MASVEQIEQRYRYIILGAGASGLSLCFYLLEHGVRDPILILDRKAAFTDDRTWCFWDVHPTPFTHLAAHCWHHWDVFEAGGQEAAQMSPAVGYACLHSRDFYAHVLETIHRCGNVTLALGCPTESCHSLPDHAAVQAGGVVYQGDYIFDSRFRPAPEDDGALTQRFFGQFVRTEHPCFDPARCTLMDFRVSQADGLHFFYVLPFSPTEALVENTYIQDSRAGAIMPEQHRAEIAAYLTHQQGAAGYTVAREEAGAIPMTMRTFPKRDGRVFFIGTAGGCTKPSSGYTFTRIQAQCRQIAEAAAGGTLDRFQEQSAPPRYRFFDAVFLQALRDQPAAFPGYFQRLFARVPPDALTSFLSESGTWHSDSKIIRSLPLVPFLRAALQASLHIGRPSRGCGPG